MTFATNELTAILLCGGKGTRLRPFTENLPKPLVPLRDRPLLSHLMRYLAQGGVRRFVVCVGYKAEAIEQFLETEKAPDWHVTCVNSGDASMTERLLDARPHVPGPALICYGDTLANVDLAELAREHRSRSALMTVTVYPLHSPFGIINFDGGGRITEFREKPRLPHWINIGFMLCEPGALELLARQTDMPGFLQRVARTGKLYAHRHEGRHLTVNTEQERSEAESAIIEFYTIPSDPLP